MRTTRAMRGLGSGPLASPRPTPSTDTAGAAVTVALAHAVPVAVTVALAVGARCVAYGRRRGSGRTVALRCGALPPGTVGGPWPDRDRCGLAASGEHTRSDGPSAIGGHEPRHVDEGTRGGPGTGPG
ncbi:hypothetical protein ACFWUW_31765, partial [Streptomyces sp. NPDC058655]